MNLFDVFLLGLSLSLDTFAVSLTFGFVSNKTSRPQRIRYLVIIGLFHFIMIMGGWFIGENISKLISLYGHWIAFVLLTLLGIQMIGEGTSKEENETPKHNFLSLRNTMILGMALSIDALISGFSLGMVTLTIIDGTKFLNTLIAAAIIGLCASALSAIAISIGKKSSPKLSMRAEILGGLIIIFIALKILTDHLCYA